MHNVLNFPRLNSCARTKQIITRAQELGILDLINRAGLCIGDTVRHNTYGWSGKIIAFDLKNIYGKHIVVEVPMGEQVPVAITVGATMLRLVKEGVA
jgi:hypothetical protein